MIVFSSSRGVSAGLLMLAQQPQAGGQRGAQPPPATYELLYHECGQGRRSESGWYRRSGCVVSVLSHGCGAGNKTWHAYMSTQGPGAVNARIASEPDRGMVPGSAGRSDVGDLHAIHSTRRVSATA